MAAAQGDLQNQAGRFTGRTENSAFIDHKAPPVTLLLLTFL
ncbi:hypothetical protein HMPREF0322_02004 [Desulfitobacterium hafniense DP7]|uniref:Uncharacterized protein n=1 Tax=Desulfitobacterium hafniense DP7 TaxID=537010 RepID=G9XM18_DESHA|nr:hypothetical protein HMPREF0322_02004 [Desulfitobacterium hafniense DP7]